jgi:curved DNA-binding protein CbpA
MIIRQSLIFYKRSSPLGVFCLRQSSILCKRSSPPLGIFCFSSCTSRRTIFTNGQVTKKDDPYAILGLQWGDGATTTEIRQAFRERAKVLHPDVVDRTVMTIEQAHEEFLKLAKAYETLTKHLSQDDKDNIEEWRTSLWRQLDRIALDRTDVAGVARKRPAKPAQTQSSNSNYGRELGHPSGQGIIRRRGEYLSSSASGDDSSSPITASKKLRSSSVGRGQSKWANKTKQKGEYKEWSMPSESIDNTRNVK